jgi:thermitase
MANQIRDQERLMARFRTQRSKRTVTDLIHVFAFVCSFLVISASWASSLEVKITGEKLTVHAESVPLQVMLKHLAREGIKVRIDPELNPSITASFENRDMQKGLEFLLLGLNHLLIWESTPAPSGTTSRLTEIQIFRPGKKELMKPLKEGSALLIGQDAEGKLYVRDEILISLKPGSGAGELEKTLTRVQGKVLDQYPQFGVYRIQLPHGADVFAAAKAAADTHGIEKAEANYAYVIAPPLQYAKDYSPPLPSSGPDADRKSFAVAVLDSGLMPGSGLDAFVLASVDVIDSGQPISDPLGHGTQMALIASGAVKPLGVNPSSATLSPIIPVRVIDENGYTSSADLMAGVDFAMKNGARVLSMSWGSETKSQFLETMIEDLSSKGLLIIASAGNEPTGRPYYPAAYSSVIAVGALDPQGKIWEKSNFGEFVDVSAPGFAALPVGYRGDPGTYAGTSISAAFVANLTANALYLKRDLTTRGLIQFLKGR